MTNAETAVLLPMDNASVVVPTGQYGLPSNSGFENPFETVPDIVLKHLDGELHRINTAPENSRQMFIERRHELEIDWQEQVLYSLGAAVAIITDEQAFGFRRDRTPANSTDTELVTVDELVEIEPLNRGGIIVESHRHLPIVLHRTDLTLWCLRKTEEHTPDTEDSHPDSYAYTIETRNTDDEYGEWEVKDVLHPDYGVSGAVEEFADHVGVKVLTGEDCSSDVIQETLDQHVFWFGEAADGEEEELRNRLGIQNNTVLFDDETPDDFTLTR